MIEKMMDFINPDVFFSEYCYSDMQKLKYLTAK